MVPECIPFVAGIIPLPASATPTIYAAHLDSADSAIPASAKRSRWDTIGALSRARADGETSACNRHFSTYREHHQRAAGNVIAHASDTACASHRRRAAPSCLPSRSISTRTQTSANTADARRTQHSRRRRSRLRQFRLFQYPVEAEVLGRWKLDRCRATWPCRDQRDGDVLRLRRAADARIAMNTLLIASRVPRRPYRRRIRPASSGIFRRALGMEIWTDIARHVQRIRARFPTRLLSRLNEGLARPPARSAASALHPCRDRRADPAPRHHPADGRRRSPAPSNVPEYQGNQF